MTVTDRTFKDPQLERAFLRDGYVTIPGLIADDVMWWRRLYAQTHPRHSTDPTRAPFVAFGDTPADWCDRRWPGTLFQTGIFELEPPARALVDEVVIPRWDAIAARVLADHDPLIWSFVMKWPGDDSVMPLHQDPTVVDEREHTSVTVWLALDDTDAELDNGPLHLIPASHRFGAEVRGAGNTPSYQDKLRGVWRLAVPIATRAGDALISDSRLLHGSPPNRSSAPRLAVSCSMGPRGAEVVFPVAAANGIDVHLVDVGAAFLRRHFSPSVYNSPPPLDDRPIVATVPAITEPIRLPGFDQVGDVADLAPVHVPPTPRPARRSAATQIIKAARRWIMLDRRS